jgi:Ras-related protein Rab-1A
MVELWDTTGQDRFRNVVTNFFRGADGLFITFDMTSDKSLKDLG